MAPPPRANPVPLLGRPPGRAEAPRQGGSRRAGARRGVARRWEQAPRRCTGPAARQSHRYALTPLPFTSVRAARDRRFASRVLSSTHL
jgi:hypothetical protein